jgi:hypothetical protein
VHFGRPLTADDVETATRLLDHHLPLDQYAERTVCASAMHKIVVPTWPCRDRVWAERVLAARDRGEITGAAR